jgi:hypothetical protein
VQSDNDGGDSFVFFSPKKKTEDLNTNLGFFVSDAFLYLKNVGTSVLIIYIFVPLYYSTFSNTPETEPPSLPRWTRTESPSSASPFASRRSAGNTCFMNACLQGLLHCPPLVALFAQVAVANANAAHAQARRVRGQANSSSQQ